MRNNRLFATGFAAAIVCATVSLDSHAQTRAQSRAQAQPAEKCLRALDGSCTNSAMVEAASIRNIIIPSVRVSYYGTPAGTIGGNYIYFERFFQDNNLLWGLPTVTCPVCNIVRRTK